MNDLLYACVDFFDGCDFDYAICGGYALELFTNMKIRPHSDIDVWISDADKEKSVQYILDKGWEIYEPLGNYILHRISNPYKQRINSICAFGIKQGCSFIELELLENGNYKMQIIHREQLQFDFVELIFNPHIDGNFLFSQNQAISRRMDKARLLTPDNVPYMAPELVLFCKSIYIDREGYQADFDITVPFLSQEQTEWLLHSLIKAYPEGHAWIDPLLLQMKRRF